MGEAYSNKLGVINPLVKLSRTNCSTISASSSNIRRRPYILGRVAPSFSSMWILILVPLIGGGPSGLFLNISR